MVAGVASQVDAQQRRPATVKWAVILAVGIQVVGIPFMFAPGASDVPGIAVVIGIVTGLLTLVGAWGMWNLHRWGAILALVVTFLNTLSAVPGLFMPPSGWILAELVVLIPLGVVDMILIALPASWRAYRSE